MTATETKLSDRQIVLAGKATFTFSGKGRSWTFRVAKKEFENSKAPCFFVKLLTGPNNDADYTYLGMLDATTGVVRLTKASTMTPDTESFRGLNWLLKQLWDGTEDQLAANGFELRWSCKCQRCGHTLTVASSIDNRLGPECAQKV